MIKLKLLIVCIICVFITNCASAVYIVKTSPFPIIYKPPEDPIVTQEQLTYEYVKIMKNMLEIKSWTIHNEIEMSQ